VAVAEMVTIYAIRRGRGFEQAAELIGKDYAGLLVRDGWGPYRGFKKAVHQTCVAHYAKAGIMRRWPRSRVHRARSQHLTA